MIYMKKTTILVILDGWGIGVEDETNPIHAARPQEIKYIEQNFPGGMLQASGIAVGLPWNEEGNSEVGHITLGGGTVLYQHYPLISLSIRNGSFFKKEGLKEIFRHVEENKSSLHLVGLVGDGIVHSAFEHLEALIKMAAEEKCSNLFIHAFSDGRDSGPHAGKETFKKLQKTLERGGVGKIASISGRYFGMDRDKRWDRTEKAYKVLIQKEDGKTVEEIFDEAKKNGVSDEYIEPTVVGEGHPIKTNDAVLFFNFREDRMRQLTEVFLNKGFSGFSVTDVPKVKVLTLTEYDSKFSVEPVFKKEKVPLPLGKVLSDNEKVQLRIAETEKYAHITYFFNGLHEPPYPNEYRVLIPSKKVPRYDETPEMMASAITDRVLSALSDGSFDFILINYANTDMVAHTGNYEATVKAVQVVDREIGRLVKGVLSGGHTLIITSDHGNAEVVLNIQTGEKDTKHNANPVPFYLVGEKFRLKEPKDPLARLPSIGFLSDVAPTILELLEIGKPREMTGQSLLKQLL